MTVDAAGTRGVAARRATGARHGTDRHLRLAVRRLARPLLPAGLPQRLELAYVGERLTSVEVNGSFYSLQRPSSWRSWAEQVPEDFVFAVKGPRFVTHMKKLNDVETPLATFFASGVLSLGERLGPLLWQLPPNLGFHPDRLAAFFDLLPRTTAAASSYAAAHHDADKLKEPADASTPVDRPLHHVLEVRHASFRTAEVLRAAARPRHRDGGGGLRRHVADVRRGDERRRLRPAARRHRAVRQRLLRRGPRPLGRQGAGPGRPTASTSSSTSTTTPRCTPPSTPSRSRSGWGSPRPAREVNEGGGR